MADSFQCMTKFTTNKKKERKKMQSSFPGFLCYKEILSLKKNMQGGNSWYNKLEIYWKLLLEESDTADAVCVSHHIPLAYLWLFKL